MKRKYIIIILSALFVFVGLVSVCIITLPRVIERFFYPLAPPMPPVVSKSTSQILSELEATLKTNAPRVLEHMQAGLSDGEIKKLELAAGIQLPADIKTLYRWHDGCQSRDPLSFSPIPGHRFLPLNESLGLSSILSNQLASATASQRAVANVVAGHRKSWICLFDDGSGDGYFYDPKRKTEEGAIFYTFTQDASFVFFPSLKNLLAGTVKCYETGAYSWTNQPSGPGLDEDFDKSKAVWDEFGASNIR